MLSTKTSTSSTNNHEQDQLLKKSQKVSTIQRPNMKSRKGKHTGPVKSSGMKPKQIAVLNSTWNLRKWDKHVFEKQQLLFDGAVDVQTFEDSCKFLTPESYQDVVVERAADNQCGYPACDMKLKSTNTKSQFRISAVDRKVYDVTEIHSFCCSECFAASKYLATQLSSDPVYLRDVTKLPVLDLVPARKKLSEHFDQNTAKLNLDLTSSSKAAESSQENALGKSQHNAIHSYIDTLITSMPTLKLDESYLPIIEKPVALSSLDQSATAGFAFDGSISAMDTDVSTHSNSAFDLIEGYRAQSIPFSKSGSLARLSSSTAKSSWISSLPKMAGPSMVLDTVQNTSNTIVDSSQICSQVQPDDISMSENHIDSITTATVQQPDKHQPVKPPCVKKTLQYLRFSDPIEAPEFIKSTPTIPVVAFTESKDEILPLAMPKSILKQTMKPSIEPIIPLPNRDTPGQTNLKAPIETMVVENALVSNSKDVLDYCDAKESDDEDIHSKTSTDTADYGWFKPSTQKAKPLLSLFARIWMILDRIVTCKTLNLLVEYTKGTKHVERSSLVGLGNQEFLKRKEFFFEKMIKTWKLIRQRHGIDLNFEYELLCIVDTLNLNESMTALSAIEEWVLCSVFIRSVCDSLVESNQTPDNINWTEILEPAGMGNDELSALVRGTSMVKPQPSINNTVFVSQ
ncbi:hypothetical protein BDEG_24827 [Batrachochytrium dendrobatidis JEL423]|uniref:RNA polymerase II subunit B1 CTD phosphatase RPAP2 homolog n=1 Tax=Batrachochytrium dendrobatidis (strain JEL423) TaxID=403673 RepID=A0A177WP28_BATDL|nr:hypothetical protein BDEG_24827 [Batrachochytrium dendrobatidis JEL423]